MAVYATVGGRRFHVDAECRALIAGQSVHGDGSHYAGTGYLIGVWPVGVVLSVAAARAGFTACRVCVPDADALPGTGETYGHRPWFVCLPDFRKGYGCARCRRVVRVPNISDDDEVTRWHHETHAVPWPCMSALVLGLAPRGGA